jgi:hypothetical protein
MDDDEQIGMVSESMMKGRSATVSESITKKKSE